MFLQLMEQLKQKKCPLTLFANKCVPHIGTEYNMAGLGQVY